MENLELEVKNDVAYFNDPLFSRSGKYYGRLVGTYGRVLDNEIITYGILRRTGRPDRNINTDRLYVQENHQRV